MQKCIGGIILLFIQGPMARVSGRFKQRGLLRACATFTCGLKTKPCARGYEMVQCRDLWEEIMHCGCMGACALNSSAF